MMFHIKNEKIGVIKSFPALKTCPKTVSGNHHWTDKTWFIAGVYPEGLPECLACGLIDDRNIKK